MPINSEGLWGTADHFSAPFMAVSAYSGFDLCNDDLMKLQYDIEYINPWGVFFGEFLLQER